MRRNNSPRMPIERFQRICAMLNRAHEPITTAQMASKLEVSCKTVDRDLVFMRDRLRLPIEADHRGHFLEEKVELCRCCAGRINGKQL